MKFERYGIGIAKGLTVTIKHLFRHPVTSQYPEQRLHISRRTRGNELIWDRNKCTGCATCAKTCPQGVIRIVTSAKTDDNSYEVETIEIDTGYCISCGLCVEACPFNALFMGYAFERAMYRRGDLIQSNDGLLATADRKPSAFMHPELAEGLPQQTLLLERITEKD